MGKVDIDKIPPEQVGAMARTVLASVQVFYSDPENRRKFEEWQEGQKRSA